MYKSIVFLLVVSSSLAHDAVIWSNKIDNTQKTIQSIIDTPPEDTTVLLFSLNDFSLDILKAKTGNSPAFIQRILASPLKEYKDVQEIKIPKNSQFELTEVANIDSLDAIPAESFNGNFVAILSDPSVYDLALQRVKRVGIRGEEDDEDRPSSDVGFGDGSRSRPKSKSGSRKSKQRVSNLAADDATFDLPLVLPPYDGKGVVPGGKPEWGTCLFYLESLNVYVFNKAKGVKPTAVRSNIGTLGGGNKYAYVDDGYVNCIQARKGPSETWKPDLFSFRVRVAPGKAVPGIYEKDTIMFNVDEPVDLILTFSTFPGYTWGLVNVKVNQLNVKRASNAWLSKDLTVKSGTDASNISVGVMAVGAYGDYNFACSETKVAVFDSDDAGYSLAVAFGNVQIQAYGYQLSKEKNGVRFSHNTHDCVGTFSSGSWMGIIVTLILVSVLMFGFLMLNSVQTMDRFDDPKQKQLIINAKE